MMQKILQANILRAKIPYQWLSLLFVMLLTLPVYGQMNPYWVNFETGFTHPASKSYASADTVLADSIPWTMPGVYLGTMTANDFKNGNHAARFRLTNNTSGNPAYMELLQDLPWGVEQVSFYTAMYGTETGGELQVFYSVDSGQNWLPAGDTIFVTASHDSAMYVSVPVAVAQPVRLKIGKLNTDDSRIDVDDIAISRYGTGHFVFIDGKMPTGTQVSIFTDSLKIHFDHPVTSGQGTLSLVRSEGGTQQITIPSSQVVAQDSTVLITGVQLQDNSHYYVLLSDSAFLDTFDTLYSVGINDSTFWHFETEDTITPPDIPPLQNLSESFLACNAAQNLMGLFHAYNISGSQVWQCSSEGHNDYFAVSISGGFGTGVSAENEDWLISELPFDLSEMTEPVLSFWQKGVYGGNVVRTVRISTNYPGYGNPMADSVDWITLNIPGINQEPDNQWNLMDGIDLSAFKSQVFYLAFTYACGTDGAYELFYDDMKIQNPTGILETSINDLQVNVLGNPKRTSVSLQIEAKRKQNVFLTVYNLQGQTLQQIRFMVPAGKSYRRIPLPDLSSGLYILRLFNGKIQIIRRFTIR